mgnify:CR=1 FL=1
MKKIDPLKEGIGITGDTMKSGGYAPDAECGGRKLYRRIFIRLRTPAETLTCSPIEDGEDFARRASIIEQWFNTHIRGGGNFLLTFEAVQVSDDEADEMTRLDTQRAKEKRK